jgi:transcriptional regulator with XRE-family HTH domain
MPRRLILTFDEREAVAQLAQRLRLARLRRNLSQVDIAERAGLSRSSYLDIENGNPGVSLAALVKVLAVLGYPERIGALLETDPVGEDLEAFHGRKRAGSRRDVEDF